MPRFSRRRLIESLGLAASAPLLAPITRTLISEAQGAPASARRIAMFFVIGECGPVSPPWGCIPETVPVSSRSEKTTSVFQMPVDAPPSMFAPMAGYWKKMAIFDGLYNKVGQSQHGYGWGCLSGVAPTGGAAEYGGQPTTISIDQHVAQTIGKSSPLSSILFGFDGDKPRDRSANTFAAGRGQPLSQIGKPSLLYENLIGKGSGAAPAGADPMTDILLQTTLLDSMRHDVRRLQAELAAPERVRLDGYLKAVEDYDRRQDQARKALQSGDCGKPPQGMDGRPEDRLTSMFNMAGLALRCGLTNVLGVSIGHGFGHGDLSLFKGGLFGPEGYGDHSYKSEVYGPPLNKLYRFFMQNVADLLTSLGPLADNATFMLVPGSGSGDSCHHADEGSWPFFAAVYDGTGAIKTGGRYVSYPRRSRSLVDLFCNIAHAAGAPIDKFGEGGQNASKGPIADLMT